MEKNFIPRRQAVYTDAVTHILEVNKDIPAIDSVGLYEVLTAVSTNNPIF
jgi:hypothetical protein